VIISIARLPLVGGHPALDLVNTVTPRVAVRGESPMDHVTDPSALLSWSRRAGFLDAADEQEVAASWQADAGAGFAALVASREIRDALHEVLLASMSAPDASPSEVGIALDRLQGRWAAAVARAGLVVDPAADPVVRLAVGAVAASRITDRLADATVELLRSLDVARLRRCPLDEGGCGWMFLDASRNGSRRWCRMADCGTEVKTRRLTERRRADRNHHR
jgi:predicted RNA-binding Zn ribbon-like protein